MIAKNLTRAFVAILLLFSISLFVSASIDVNYYSTVNDFTLETGSTELSLCQCAAYTDTVKVTNVGDSRAVFQVSSNLDLVKVVDSAFSLDKGESKTVRLNMAVPCAAEGVYDLKINVQNDLGKQKIISKSLSLGKCQNLKVDFFAPNVTKGVEPCSDLKFNIVVSNPGVFQEQYTIDMPQFEDMTVISEKDFFLQSKASKNISLKTKFPCDVYGTKNLVFNVNAVSNKLKVSIPFSVNILQNYNFSLTQIAESSFCYENGKQSFPVEIKNLVNVPNNYSLKLLNAPSFVTPEEASLALKGKEKQTVYIFVDAKELYQGDYDFVLHAKSGIGNTNNDLPIHVKVWSCFGLELSLPVESASVCQDTYQYDVVVRNDGSFKDNFSMSLSGPEFTSLSEEWVVLEPGQESVVKLKVEAPNQDTENDVVIKATLSSGLAVSKTFHLKTYSAETCFKVNAEKKDFTVYKGITEIMVPVKNYGSQAGKYDIELENSNAPWITTEEDSVELEPGQTKEIKLLVDLKSQGFGDYPVDLLLTKGLEEKDIVYHNVLNVKYTDVPFDLKVTRYLSNRPCMLAMGILLLLFVVLLISVIAIKTVLGRKRPRMIWIPLIVLIVLFVLAAVFVVYNRGPLTSMYPAVEPSQEKDEFVWQEDTTYTLNLSKYFSDPDKDVLYFSVLGPEHIKVDFKGSIAYLTPEKDWFGEEAVVFSAYDNRGGVADSPFMTLKVVDMQEYSFRNRVEFYCAYINLALLLIVLALVYLIFWKKAGTGRPTKAQREAMKNNNNSNNAPKKAARKR